jgi:hypothetical protein
MVAQPPPVDPVPIALKIARAFERLGIPYRIGGSLASTFYGEPRSTFDVDFAAHLELAQCAQLASVLRLRGGRVSSRIVLPTAPRRMTPRSAIAPS